MRGIGKRGVPPVFSLVVWALLWELLGRYGGTDLLPPISSILLSMVEIVQLGSFRHALLVTAEAFALGLGLSILVGIPLGVLMGLRRAADRLFSVWVDIFLSAPLTALVPALMPLLGIGQATVVATVFLFSVWVVVIDTQAGILHASRSLVEMGRVFGAKPRNILFEILLPAALPEIMTGIRMAVIRGVKGVIIGQIIIALIGFGELFELYLQGFLMEQFWALVFIIFTIAFIIIGIVEYLEKKVEFYAASR